ncbi:hypothetical protein IID24_00375, partial [Patescibacteria group bacterium]|nr:hypothetical protein [Patescibacteria group bacterium]
SANAQGATLQDLQAQIQALLSQIAQLQAQLNQSQGGIVPPAFCYNFQSSLRLGDRGRDVEALQEALQKEGLYIGTIAGNFDVATFQAAVTFQEKYQREVLSPFGITRGTGFVGRTTRAKLNALYGCGIIPRPIPQKPVITSITAPAALEGVIYSGERAIIYGTGLSGALTIKLGVQEPKIVQVVGTGGNSVWFTVPQYLQTSYVSITVANSENSISNSYPVKVEVSTPLQPSITVLSPNGGETWTIGSMQTVRWVSLNIPKGKNVSIGLIDVAKSTTYGLSTRNANDGTDTFIVPSYIPAGLYKVEVSIPEKGGAEDVSDGFISLVATTTVVTVCDSYGDVNLDGTVNILDVILVNQYIANLTILTAEQLLRADVDQGGSVTSTDATYILEFITGTRSSFPACEKTPPCASYGDVNNNGIVNLRDVDLILKHITGIISLTAEQQKRADVNGDGVANIFDIIAIRQYAGGTSTTFSVCPITILSVPSFAVNSSSPTGVLVNPS